MTNTSRRRLLAAAGAGIAAVSAGCLDDFGSESEPDTSDDNNDGTDDAESDPTDAALSPLEQWIPASGSEEFAFHYRDLAAVREHADALASGVVDDVPRAPEGTTGAIVERVSTDAPLRSVLEFGPKEKGRNYVVAGSFDPAAIDGEPASTVGDFEVYDRDDSSVAVSAATIVSSGPHGATVDAMLAAGTDRTDRRADESERFASLLEELGEHTFVWGGHDESNSDDGPAVAAYSWTLGEETTAASTVAVYPDSDRTDEFERQMADTFDDVSVETDGNVGVATRTIPTSEFAYRDLFAERSGSARQAAPQAGVEISVNSSSRTVDVVFTASGNTDVLEIHDDDGKRAELTEVGEMETLEYDAGESGTIRVVAVNDEAQAEVATESFEF